MKYVKQIFALKLIFCACANLVAAERPQYQVYRFDFTGQELSVVHAFIEALKCRSEINEGSMPPCFACNTGGASLKCGRCHAAVYCGEDCQMGHWSAHSSICSGSGLTPRQKAFLRAMGAIIP